MASPAAAPHPEPRLLVVGASGAALATVTQCAAEDGARVEVAPDLPRAARQLAAGHWDLVVAILGERPEDELAWWAETLPGVGGGARLIAAVQQPTVGLVLRAEKLGVLDVVSLPLRRDDVRRAMRALRAAAVEVPLPLPPVEAQPVGGYALVGQSAAMLEVYKLMARVAPSAATVLIEGESGTGKEVMARAVHLNSPRASAPFVAVNCAAIPENLLESELFGHEKGAFTGAVTRKIGRFEQASRGTLFLDEIADMSAALQAKILRAVQERVVERVGGGEPVPADVRLIAATNRSLRELVAQGRFREDLYYRLAVVTIQLPRLADRGDDLLLLTAYFARQFAQRYGKTVDAVSDRALELLRNHHWVGNVRELRNVIERAVIVASDSMLRADLLPEELRGGSREAAERPAGLPTLAENEARHIARVLAHTGGQVGAAAAILGIHRNTLTRKIREYGL